MLSKAPGMRSFSSVDIRYAISDVKCGGFSILEMIAIIAIIGVVTGIAILKLPDWQAGRDQIALQELMAHLRYIHSLAMNREATTRIVFDVAGDSYAVTIADLNAPGGYRPLKDPVTQNDWVVKIPDEFSGVGLKNVNINGNNVLLFSETNGIPCDVSGVPITANGSIVFDSGLGVEITPDTGYVF